MRSSQRVRASISNSAASMAGSAIWSAGNIALASERAQARGRAKIGNSGKPRECRHRSCLIIGIGAAVDWVFHDSVTGRVARSQRAVSPLDRFIGRSARKKHAFRASSQTSFSLFGTERCCNIRSKSDIWSPRTAQQAVILHQSRSNMHTFAAGQLPRLAIGEMMGPCQSLLNRP